ncbi:PREDICTED: WAP four-disulfide core domain protein 3-like, partial [Calidris pugnax]|uniref:WAP four-disulfide core domain protein 3-like n=1 Tax=Calidris pugnax TaxID=198806 RepID=UPI00071DB5E0
MKPEMLLPLLLLLVLPAPPLVSGKFGQCPESTRYFLRLCDDFCSSNDDCPGSELCCRTGCGRECVLPKGAKRGSCPQSEPGLITTCDVRCNSDSECPGDEKCCSVGCRVQCVKPEP